MLHEILHFFGGAICHQLEDRSLQASGKTLSICARDTGIYIGIFSTLAYLHISKRKKAITIPTIKVSFFLLLLMTPLMFDGLGSYLHLFETNNLRRLVSGILFGLALPYFLYPLLSKGSLEQGSEPVMKHRRDLGVPLFISLALGIVVYGGKLPYFILDGFFILLIMVWFSLLSSFLYSKLGGKWMYSIVTSLSVLSLLSLLHKLVLSNL